jgi:hypothetical protein
VITTIATDKMANEGGAEVRRVDRAAARKSEELPLLARPNLLLADAVWEASRTMPSRVFRNATR